MSGSTTGVLTKPMSMELLLNALICISVGKQSIDFFTTCTRRGCHFWLHIFK
ncbi:hypothetical protein DOT_3306 [Desulfosporosinus sp. OT]|nr:hypothetical protein DOT_3306 [Desulfosporosinus sp. OT]